MTPFALASALVEEGNALSKANRWDDAREKYDAALRACPGFQPALHQMARNLVEEGSALRQNRGLDAAAAKFEESLRILPDHPPALRQLASLAFVRGDDARAIALYRAFLRQRPQVWQACLNLANSLRRVGKDLEAADAYLASRENAAEDQAGVGVSLWNLLYSRSDSLTVSIAVDAFPDELFHPPQELCRRLGDNALAANLTDLAIAAYRRALVVGVPDAAVHRAIGDAFVRMGRDTEAVQSYEQALALSPDDCGAMTSLGILLRHRGDREQAKGLAHRIEQHCPDKSAGLLFAAVEAREANDRAAVVRRNRAAFGFGQQPAPPAAEEWHLGMRLTRAHQACLVPLGKASVGTSIGGIVSDEGLPEYAHHLRVNQALVPAVLTDLEALSGHKAPAAELPGTTLYGGLFFNHFGHFMSEGPHRLWAFDGFQNEIDHVAIIRQPVGRNAAAGKICGSEMLSSFQRGALDYLGIPFDLVRVINAATATGTLLISEPGSVLGGGPFAPPTAYLDWLAGRQEVFFKRYKPKLDAYPERLYVGRGHLLSLGGIAGEGYVERLMAQEGFHLFRPERHSLLEQMNHYRHAREIVFSEGSALHGLELLGALERRPRVVVLARRPHLRNRWDGLIRSRTSSYYYFAGVYELPALGHSKTARLEHCSLSLVREPEELASFLRGSTSAGLGDFDPDGFFQQEAMDIARHLIHVYLPDAGAQQFWNHFDEFRSRLLSIGRNPYLESTLDKVD